METLRPGKILSFVALFFLGLAASLAWVQASRAQTVEIVHDFGAPPLGSNGYRPVDRLIQGTDGYLYGATQNGGPDGSGTVFRILPDGSGFRTIKAFSSVLPDGALPFAGLTQRYDGFLYGTTNLGGVYGLGTVYKISPDGSNFSVITSFQGGAEGARPKTGVIQADNGYLYGTMENGGASNEGMVYFADLIVIKSFQCGSTMDGCRPRSGVIQGTDGYLYGTTRDGGAFGDGTLFKLLPNGTSFSIIKSFHCGSAMDGCGPESRVIQGIDGYLYGTTLRGGESGQGTVYKILPDGTSFSVLKSFECGSANTNCGLFHSLLQAADGYLYGTTVWAGAFDQGSVFRIRPDGSNFSTIDSFACDGNDGCSPAGSLIQTVNGNLYGMTTEGGRYSGGTIFRVNLGFATLTANPTTVLPGGSVTANWLGIVNPSAKDWIGLYNAGAANTAFLAWEYVSCSKSPTVAKASGACPLALPANLQKGSYELRLFSNDGFTLVTASNPITVTEDGLSTVSITASIGTVPENGPGTGSFRVSRTGSTATSLTVNYTVSGTATHGTDYQTLTGSVTIPIHEEAALINVTPIDDTVYEGNETVIVRLSANPAYFVGSQNIAAVIITDNETLPSGPTISISGGNFCAPPADPTYGLCFTWGRGITVNWNNIANPAPGDWFGLYSWQGANTAFVTWTYVNCTRVPTMARASGSCELTIPTHVQPGRAYEVRLFRNDSFTLLGKSDLFTIWGPVVSIGPATSSVAENGGPVTLSVGRSGIFWIWQASDSLTVRYTIGGTATNGVDYQLLSGSITIPQGQVGVDLPITPIDDSLFEGNETLVLTIVDGGSYYWGSGSATVTILDNETPPAAPTISGSPNPVTRGSNLTATWSGIVNPTATDWFGLYAPGTANTAFLAWAYVNCSTTPTVARASGSCGLTIPAGLAVGTYELRLLANDGFSALATSGPIAVQ